MPSEYISPRISFPRPFAFVIDDMGWIQGANMEHASPRGPFRNGVKRTFDVQDYKHVVEIAKAASVRVQGLFILSELDLQNVLAQYPTTTFQRDKWDNSSLINEQQNEIIKYVVSQSAHLEFGFHGIGHEHWPLGGEQRRAEWYNLEEDHPWPEEILRQHVAAAKAILHQYGLSPTEGQSFPETFVPGAYSYYWNPHGTFSLCKLMRETGVRYANTNFTVIPELDPPQELNGGGFDHGLHVLGRLNYGNHWYELSSLPKVPLSMQPTDIVETHWANWLASDDFLQPAVSESWVDYYRDVYQQKDRYPARNTAQLHAQWLYKRYTVVRQVSEGVLAIDNSAMPFEAYDSDVVGNLVLQFVLQPGEHLSSITLDDGPVAGFFEREGHCYVYLPVLGRRRYTLRYAYGADHPSFGVSIEGTYNVLEVKATEQQTTLSVKMYGRQDVTIYCQRPSQVRSDQESLRVEKITYEEHTRMLTVTLRAMDYQGVAGMILITW